MRRKRAERNAKQIEQTRLIVLDDAWQVLLIPNGVEVVGYEEPTHHHVVVEVHHQLLDQATYVT